MVQWVKNLPTMQETHIRSLDREHPLEESMAIHSSDLAWKVSWTVHRVAESDMTEATEHALTHVCLQYKIQKFI